jgi:hypothetical protein
MITNSVANSGCFIPNPAIFSSRIPDSDSNIFLIPDPGSYMKSGMQTYFYLAFYAFRSKVLVLVTGIVKKIEDPETEIRDPKKN